MNKRTHEELEKMCKRCGRCCHEKLRVNGEVYIFMKASCPFLEYDRDKVASCKCYEERLKGTAGCITLEEAISREILPADCGYKELFPKGYRPATCVNTLRDLHVL